MILKEIVIDECNTGVMLFPADAEDLSSSLEECGNGVKNHGQYMKCVSSELQDAVSEDILTGAQKGDIESCAAKSGMGKKK